MESINPAELDRFFTECGKRIAYARKSKGISQEELAHQIGCSAKYISMLENGARPSMEMLYKLHLFLERDYDFFIPETSCQESHSVINGLIAEKISKCTPYTIHLLEGIIDGLLLKQEDFPSFAKAPLNKTREQDET